MTDRNIVEATRSFEAWLAQKVPIVRADLNKKHRDMARDSFVFLRATYYRFAELYPELCPELMDAPVVYAVCDIHLENFSNWRDLEGRLVWGINDFDEAFPMPYTIDLVRLACSARMAIQSGELDIKFKRACRAILSGYSAGMREGIKPFVLAEDNRELYDMASRMISDPLRFWRKLDCQVNRRVKVPQAVKDLLVSHLPEGTTAVEFARRTAGKGSLGRPRFVALGEWNGGRIARECKLNVTSACIWAGLGDQILHADAIVRKSQGFAGDPYTVVDGEWTVRRLAPDCTKIEFSDLPSDRHEEVLLTAMGRDLANKHLGTPDCSETILEDLRNRDDSWLKDSARVMSASVRSDQRDWARHLD